jgi:hypothetical protein
MKKIAQKKKGGGATKRDLNPQPKLEKIKSNDEILKELFVDRDYNKQRPEYNILENYLLSIDGVRTSCDISILFPNASGYVRPYILHFEFYEGL